LRKLRIVISAAGAVPVLVAALVPSLEACGTDTSNPDGSTSPDATAADATDDRVLRVDATMDAAAEAAPDAGPGPICGGWPTTTHIVPLPASGVPADPGQLCAVVAPAQSSASARATFTNYDRAKGTAIGAIAIPAPVLGQVLGTPSLTVVGATNPAMTALTITTPQKTSGGFTFQAKWAAPIAHSAFGESMTVKVSFVLSCGDAGTQVVESLHTVEACVDGEDIVWVSAGGACTVCQIIAEMAPTPIVSDNTGDDLPLARHLRLRVVELARAGRDVVLFAENDGGHRADYEWRVSTGTLRPIAPDIVVWTLPEEGEEPFGQVAVWNEAGAAVENFLWSAA
jgi:hypothetical protein